MIHQVATSIRNSASYQITLVVLVRVATQSALNEPQQRRFDKIVDVKVAHETVVTVSTIYIILRTTHLHGGECVAVAVSCDLSRATDVVIADSSPPDDRRRVCQLSDQLVHSRGVDTVVQLRTQSAVPAFDQVDDVHHQHERHGDVDVAVVAGADQSCLVPASRTDAAVHVQLTPGQCCQAAGHQRAEHEALPVAVPAQRPTERQTYRLLLQRQQTQFFKNAFLPLGLYTVYGIMLGNAAIANPHHNC